LEVRLDRLGRVAVLEVMDDDRQRHMVPDDIEAPVPAFNEFLDGRTCPSVTLFALARFED